LRPPAAGTNGRTMTEPDHALVARVVQAIGDRTDAQCAALAIALAARWSPPDRHEPAAAHWLRHWHPRPAHFPPPACSCKTGRCLVCN
jgi:hypothetical protein